MAITSGPFRLNELSEEKLDLLIGMSEEEKTSYIDNLIDKYYPSINKKQEMYNNLQQCYRSSFIAEKMYRNNTEFRNGFSTVYTRTGLIRDIVSDIFFTTDNLIVH